MIFEKAFLACILELLAPKPGNVNRYHDFKNKTIVDFMYGSIAVARTMRDIYLGENVGDAILEGVQTMIRLARGNTHLGILIMFFPIVMASRSLFFWNRVELVKEATELLKEIPPEETAKIAKAIKYVSPPLPPIKEKKMDATVDNVLSNILAESVSAYEWFKYGSESNIVARELVSEYPVTIEATKFIEENMSKVGLSQAIVRASIFVLSRNIDTHMLAEKGETIAIEATDRAREVVKSDYDESLIRELDEWLRSNEANPGAIADIITTAIFLLMMEGVL